MSVRMSRIDLCHIGTDIVWAYETLATDMSYRPTSALRYAGTDAAHGVLPGRHFGLCDLVRTYRHSTDSRRTTVHRLRSRPPRRRCAGLRLHQAVCGTDTGFTA
eukprot:1823344-Rhodomonas_salina.2